MGGRRSDGQILKSRRTRGGSSSSLLWPWAQHRRGGANGLEWQGKESGRGGDSD